MRASRHFLPAGDMDSYLRSDSAGSFKPFGVVSNESLRVSSAMMDSLKRGGGGRFQPPSASSSAAGRDGQSRGIARTSAGSRRCGLLVLFAAPQELGGKCANFMREQRSRLQLIRRCAVMLACWHKHR